jgi:hypothetical protein
MTNKIVENMKGDAKKTVSDIGNKMSHAKADARSDVEKAKAKFGHGNKLEKKAAYAKADIKADASKAKADVGNKMVHAKAEHRK